MSKNKLIIAAAGSGKTTLLIKRALKENGNVLILTYTLANEETLKRRLTESAGCIPANITIQTWFSFLLQHGVKPFQGCLHESMFEQNVRGMKFESGRSGVRYESARGKRYWGQNDFSRYYFNGWKIYSDKLSEFAVKCNDLSKGAVVGRIARIYGKVFIDEVQDLAGYDLDLIKALLASSMSVLLVGDPRQVTYLTHWGLKYKKYRDGKILDFVENALGRTLSCEVDTTTLNASHRCTNAICEYASLLYSELDPTVACTCCRRDAMGHEGVFLVRPKDVDHYVENFPNVMQLRWNKKTGVHPVADKMNFGESKGLTFDRVLIHPTKKIAQWIADDSKSLTNEARAKFYVALTRARFSAAIVVDIDAEFNSGHLVQYDPNGSV